MGATTNKAEADDQTVETKPANADTVKKSDLLAFYNEGHSPQEVADEFNVEVASVLEVLDLNDKPNGTDEFGQPVEAAKDGE
jgi:hypothetical protein